MKNFRDFLSEIDGKPVKKQSVIENTVKLATSSNPMRHLIEAVTNPQILTEATDYFAMFNQLLGYCDEKQRIMFTNILRKEVKLIKSVLKKDNRVVWYLRFYRVGFARELFKDKIISEDIVDKVALSLKEKYSIKYIKDYGIAAYHQVVANMREFEHMLSLPIAEMQTMDFEGCNPNQVIKEMSILEEEWKKDQNNKFVPEDKDEIVIDFNNGWAWWLLDRPYCRQEGNAMGHCGNSASYESGDRILSLRKSLEVNGVKYVSPHVTCVLHDDGRLGEMKGRNNDKPTAKYHDYIVALLRKTDLITGMKGGGHAAENNFKISDLDSEVADELLEEHPHLGSPIKGAIEKYGLNSQEVADEIFEVISNSPYPAPKEITVALGTEFTEYILHEWRDFSYFVNHLYNDGLSYLMLLYEDEDERQKLIKEQITSTENIESDLVESLRLISNHSMRKLCKYFETNFVSSISPKYNSMLDNLSSKIMNDPDWNHDIEDIIGLTLKYEGLDATLLEMVKDRILKYIKSGFPFKLYNVYLKFEENNNLDKPVTLRMSISDMMGIVEEIENPNDDGDESGINYLNIYDNWYDLCDRDSTQWEQEEDFQTSDGADTVFGTEKKPLNPFENMESEVTKEPTARSSATDFKLTSPEEKTIKPYREAAHSLELYIDTRLN